MVGEAAGYMGDILYDESKPDGQYRKRLDLTTQTSLLGKAELTSLEAGIASTVAWYEENIK